jgi:hypothetical protein
MGVYLIRNSAKESMLTIWVLAGVIPLARALHKILSLINMQKWFDLQHMPCCWNQMNVAARCLYKQEYPLCFNDVRTDLSTCVEICSSVKTAENLQI